jgi:hypothetical protein
MTANCRTQTGTSRVAHFWVRQRRDEAFEELLEHVRTMLPLVEADRQSEAIAAELFGEFVDEDGFLRQHRLQSLQLRIAEVKAKNEWATKATIIGRVPNAGIAALAKLLVCVHASK